MTEKQYKVTGSWAPYGYMDYVEHDIKCGDTIRVIYTDGRESTYHDVIAVCRSFPPWGEVLVRPGYMQPDQPTTILTGENGRYRFERVEEIEPERIEIHSPEDARPFEGRRVRLFWQCGPDLDPRGEGILRVGRSSLGDLAIGVGTGESVGSGGINAVVWSMFNSGTVAVIELLDSDPIDDARRRRDELAAELEKQTAELERLESEAAEKKAREAEAARFPLPEGWTWHYSRQLGHHARGVHRSDTVAVHVYPGGPDVIARVMDGDDITLRWTRAPLDVVRAVIARYDADNAPYCVELEGRPLRDIDHEFKAGDCIEILMENGQRHERVISRVDSDGDVFVSERYPANSGGWPLVTGEWGVKSVTRLD